MIAAAATSSGAVHAQQRIQVNGSLASGLLDPRYPVGLGGSVGVGVRVTGNAWLEADAQGLFTDDISIARGGATRHYRAGAMAVYAPTFGQKKDWGMQAGLGGSYQEYRRGAGVKLNSVYGGEYSLASMVGARFRMTDAIWVRTDLVVDYSPENNRDLNGFGRGGFSIRF